MRSLIIELNKIFGANENAKITKWVNNEFARKIDVEGVIISLEDVKEQAVLSAVCNAIQELGLTVNELTSGTYLIAALDVYQQEFTATIELRPAVYSSVINKAAKIVSESVVREGDVYERYMSDAHIVHRPVPANKGAPVLAYINGEVEQGDCTLVFSSSLSEEELAGVQASFIAAKFGGVDPLLPCEWEEVYLASVYRRLNDESIFTLVSESLNPEDLARYSKLVSFGHEAFSKEANSNNIIKCSYGRVIGKKVFRYNAIEAKVASEAKKPELVLIQGSAPAKNTPSPAQQSEEKDYQLDWGMF